ncbi:MAG: TolC family protein [Gemmatimonadota bacterium]|jgi:outer membrane protein TolC
MRSTILLATLGALAASAPGALGAQTAGRGTLAATDPVLTLPGLLDSVARRNPRLHAMEAAAVAAATRVAEASTLPDPMLQLGVMNFGLPDLNTDMASSMAPSVQLMQTVPFPGKLGLRGEIADASRVMAEAGADEAWWEVRGTAASLYWELYSLDRRTEVMRETLALLENFQAIARSMYSAGTGRQADVLRADVEVARMDGEIRKMEAMRKAVAARLNGLLDRPASTPVPSPVLVPLPSDVPAQDTLAAWADESRPLLARARTGVEQAGTRVELAHKEIWPNLTFGVTYGQRDRGMGLERMGSAMVGFSLPVHASSRQLAARDEAGAMQRMAEAELGGLRAQVHARIGELLAELDRSRSLIELYRDEVLPEAHGTVESALSSYRVGSVDFMTLVDAQMTVNRYEAELHQLVADYGKAVAGLESTVGRELPPTEQMLAGIPGESRSNAKEAR